MHLFGLSYNVEYRIDSNETVALDDFSSPTGWKVKISINNNY